MITTNSFDPLVTFDHEEHGFLTDDVINFFPEPVSTTFDVKSWQLEDAMYRIIMKRVFYMRYSDLTDILRSKTKVKATATVEVVEDFDLSFPDGEFVTVPHLNTPQFEL